MSLKQCAAVIAIAGFGSMAVAQNARVGAMGGVGVMDDFSTVISFPSDAADYGDAVQATGS